MKIIVCIKQVPDTHEIKIDPITNTLKREGVPSIINPDDKTALEAALTLKDSFGATVTALCMGPQQARKALKEAVAMGADEAILLSDRAFAGSDTWATSKILAAAISQLDYDLIICGRQAIDGDTAQVGPQIAENLNLPQVTYVMDLSYEEKSGEFTVRRQFEDRYQIIKVKGKLLITVLSAMKKPRYMSVHGIMNAEEKQIIQWGFDNIKVNIADIGLKGSPTRVKSTFTRSLEKANEVVELSPEDAAKRIVEKLKEVNAL